MNVPKLRFKGFDDQWILKSLGEITEPLKYGMNAAAKGFDGSNQYIRITDIEENTRTYLSKERVSPDGPLNDEYLLRDGDILFARTGASTGKSFIYKEALGKMYYAGFLIRARLKTSDISDFVYYQTLTEKYNRWVEVMSMRSGQPGINAREYETFSFLIPAVAEQEKIAGFFNTLNRRIEHQQAKVEALKEQKKGLLQKIFSRELRFKDEHGKDFPEWESKKLKEIADIIGGGTPSTANSANWDGDINWFTPTEIGHTKYVANSSRTITEHGLEKSSAKLLPVGTILLTTRATLGEMSITNSPATTNQGFQSLIVKEGFLNEFVFYLQPLIKKYCYKHSSGSTFMEISKKTLAEMPLLMPCKREQIKIASLFSELDKKIELEQRKITQQIQQKKALMQQMFI